MVLANYKPSIGLRYGRVEHRWPNAGAFKAALIGPSATVFGWIPVYQEQEQLPDGYLREAWPRDPAIPMLLACGNHTPPDTFDGSVDVVRHLATRDFRGCLSIDRPTLYLDAERQPSFLHFEALAGVGSTPVRVDRILLYSAGVGVASGDITAGRDRVAIRLFLRLKLGKAGQIVGRLQTGLWPPWATLTIEYAFDLRDHRAQVDFSGTAVLSVRRYVDWRLDSEYRIERDMSGPGYEGFLEAGNCQDAMAARYKTWTPLKWVEVSDED